jgi:hypothetical protein
VHEALIRNWLRLREWIDANRVQLRARAAVVQAKAEWEKNGRRQDLLLPSGFQLERARELLADPGDLTIDDIQEFIALSSARVKRLQRRITRGAVGVMILLAVATILYSFFKPTFDAFYVPYRTEEINREIRAGQGDPKKGIRWLVSTDQPITFVAVEFNDLNLSGISARAPNFDRSKLTRVNFEFSNIDFASFIGSVIDRSSFGSAMMNSANFSGATIDGAQFSDARLSSAMFDRAVLKNVDFSRADVRNASFRNTKFQGDELPKFRETGWWLATGWSLRQVEQLAALYPGLSHGSNSPATPWGVVFAARSRKLIDTISLTGIALGFRMECRAVFSSNSD